MNAEPILVIEDDISLRRVLEFTLNEAGYQVITATDGREGLELFRRERPLLVVTDLQMPGLSGFELLQTIKAERPATLVIVITAYGSVEKAVEAMKLGAHDFLAKPFSRDALRLTVEKALAYRGLQNENARLRAELADRPEQGGMIGLSDEMQQVFELIRRIAPSEATVLIQGESGTGKELVARALHRGSERRAGPFVAVNCAAIPHELLESELFGHVKGAFTGAVRDRAGKFEQAAGGTLFLDEVAELPLPLQPKLLRALQEREIEPVGATSRKVDVRVLAATNREIDKALAEGRLREDLYYRLAVIPLLLPPLRERTEDIPLLVRHFLDGHGAREVQVDDEVLSSFRRYPWPGNVRELENTVQRMLLLRRGRHLAAVDLPEKLRQTETAGPSAVVHLPPDGFPLERIEEEAVRTALVRCDWNVSAAARFLRTPRHTLIYRMEKYGITRP